jgi:hypothetical protein
MAVHELKAGQITRPAPRTLKAARFQAPLQGMDARIALTEPSPEHAVYCFNITPFEYGLAVRKGYREHQIGVDDGASVGIHTLIPFDGIESTGAEDRLFAVNNEGIWDVTDAGAAPILSLAFADQQILAGYGVYTHYTGNNEEDVLFYADSINGLFEYDAPADTWAEASGISGPVVGNINWVVAHKQRLWMIEENSTKAWYLDVGSNSGNATEFFFGSKFTHGGNLAGLFVWSVDTGNGLNDLLVAVSRAGDVLPYKGADPSIAPGTDHAWEVIGTYFIGRVPIGPFFGTDSGGELFLLSEYGLTSMNDLLQGVDSSALQARGTEMSTVAGPISGLLRRRMQRSIDLHGWQIRRAPSAGGMVINAPPIGSDPILQLYYNYSTHAWGLWRDVPMTAFDSFNGAVVFGDEDSRVLRMDVTVDELLLTPPAEGINGQPIEFSLLTTFHGLDNDVMYKRVKLIRPDFISQSPPTFTVVARYDFNISQTLDSSIPPAGNFDEWDVGSWDVGVWASGSDDPYNKLSGSWGSGRYIAIGLRGSARDTTRLIGFDIMYDVGGPLL